MISLVVNPEPRPSWLLSRPRFRPPPLTSSPSFPALGLPLPSCVGLWSRETRALRPICAWVSGCLSVLSDMGCVLRAPPSTRSWRAPVGRFSTTSSWRGGVSAIAGSSRVMRACRAVSAPVWVALDLVLCIFYRLSGLG